MTMSLQNCSTLPPSQVEIWEISPMTEGTSYYSGGEGLVKVLAIKSIY
jgi:hypothetical protein